MIRNLVSRRSPSAVASATAGSCIAPAPTRLKTSQTCYHRNQQYSIVGLTNAAGTLVERYTYSAYGTLGIYAANGTVRTSSTYANRYTYTGREWDGDLRLYHFRARWYDPATGGFVSRDPLGYVDGMSLYRGYFTPNGVDPFGLETWHTKVVGKSFIADIDKHGGVGTDPYWPTIPIGPTTGIPTANVPIPWPSDWLRGQGSYWIFNLKEDSTTDAKDGTYRLYSRLDVEFECCDGELKIDPSKPRVDRDGGYEMLYFIYGTIDIDKFTYERLSKSSMRFRYRAFGRPNKVAEPGFHAIKARTSKYIWHYVEVVISCKGNKGFHNAKFIDSSGFPSHRLWANGSKIDEKMQGTLDLLWKPDPNDPEFVAPKE